MTNLSFAVLFAATVGLAGCQDARTVDPYPRNSLIDDFEDPNEFPTDHSFERWGCRPLDEEHPINADGCNRVPDPGLGFKDGNHVLHLSAALYPMPTDVDDDRFTRAGVGTYVRDARLLDLRSYVSFSFTWKLEFESTAADSLNGISSPSLKAELSCTTARDGDAAVPQKPFMVFTITKPDFESDPQWHESLIPISSFHYPNPELGTPSSQWMQECLSRVDGIRITVDSERSVKFNHILKFDLYVADISLRPKE